MKRLLALFVLAVGMCSNVVHSDDLVLKAGAGLGIFGAAGTPFERIGAIGYQVELSQDFFVRPEFGYFNDISGHGKSSGYGTLMVGTTALAKTGVELYVGVGPAYLQYPDEQLGGNFQFAPEFGLGIKRKDNYLGASLWHLSSGGINMPNHGRTFFGAEWRHSFQGIFGLFKLGSHGG